MIIMLNSGTWLTLFQLMNSLWGRVMKRYGVSQSVEVNWTPRGRSSMVIIDIQKGFKVKSMESEWNTLCCWLEGFLLFWWWKNWKFNNMKTKFHFPFPFARFYSLDDDSIVAKRCFLYFDFFLLLLGWIFCTWLLSGLK